MLQRGDESGMRIVLYVGGHASGMNRIIENKYGAAQAVIKNLHLWIREELINIENDTVSGKSSDSFRKDMQVNRYDVLTEMIKLKLDALLTEVNNNLLAKDRVDKTGAMNQHNEVDVVISSDLIGSGIVPMDAFDRCWREVTGRVLTDIASKADEVYRVTCGIEQRLK